MHHPKDFPFIIKNYYHYFFPKFAEKANRIATVSEYSKNDIKKTFRVPVEKIDVVYNGANGIYKPINQPAKEETKDKFSNGFDYFLFVGALSPRKNIKNLLLAFDRFKSQTKSDVKLIIAGEKMFKTKDLVQAYKKLKSKEDVLFVGRMSPEKLKNLYGASLALAFVPYFEGFGIPIIEAMNCETAVITSNRTSMPEVAKDAALLVDPFSVPSISDAMIKIYDDKELRSELIEKGKQRAKDFSWDKTANSFWESIEKVINE
jgi:glycosyltransferase involved in cell wall biosynthesis